MCTKSTTRFCLLLLLSLLTGCSGLLYYPSKQLFFPPSQFGLKPEEMEFESASQTKLFGWYFTNSEQAKPKAIFVFYHGNGENMSSHYVNLLWVLKHQYDFFIFDYAGYGKSAGKSSPEETVLDGEAALRLVAKNHPGIPLVVFGQSLGGAVALRNVIDLRAALPIRYVVIDSSFLSYEKVARKVLAHSAITWPFQWLGDLVMSDRYAPGDAVATISPLPLLIIHGDSDQVVDFSLGQEIFNKAKEPKTFWRIPNGQHTDVFSRQSDDYKTKLLELLDVSLRQKL